ncbi:MAG: DapH/DapD/GlmU-related protein [Candidatus Omnitrophota bacterium]|nr:hypothetical protein [Candidatus Omnitrophota bacterium]
MKSLLTIISQYLATIFLYSVGVLIMGLSIFPGLLLCFYVWGHSHAYSMHLRILVVSLSVAGAFFLYGMTLMALAGILRVMFRLNLKEGEHRIPSLGVFKWLFANALYMVVGATFMDFILLTPFANIFYRLMGAKIGKNVQLNSKFCADVSLLEVGDEAIIGGHATVICHSFERHRLILKKVKIGKRAIIGLNSVILPGCEIGEGALIAAGAVLSKNTHVEPRDVYCGVPAVSARERHVKEA